MDIAKLCRIYETNPSDDYVTKRIASIKVLKTAIGKKTNVNELLELGNAACEVFRAKPTLTSSMTDLVIAAIKKNNVSFVPEDRELDIAVCAISAVIEFIRESAPTPIGIWQADVLAVALWSVTDFLPPIDNPKIEELRNYASSIARQRVLDTGLSSRKRLPVEDLPQVGEAFDPLFCKAAKNAISALRSNAALDREEIDLLWWVLAERSNILNVPLSSLSPITRAVITGLEIGLNARALPSQSFRNLALKGLVDTEKLVDLQTVLQEIAVHKDAILAAVNSDTSIKTAQNVFPLLHGLSSGDHSSLGFDPSRSIGEWSARAILEGAMLRVQYDKHRVI